MDIDIYMTGMVNKAAMKGMSENIALFIPILEKKVSKKSGKSSSTPTALSSASNAGVNDSKQPSSMQANTKVGGEAKQNIAQEWFELVRDFVLDMPWQAYMAILSVLFLWMLASWLRSGPSEYDASPSTLLTHSPDRVNSRAVYLKDLQEGLIQLHLEGIPYADAERLVGIQDEFIEWYY